MTAIPSPSPGRADDRKFMGAATDAKLALIEKSRIWRELRQPSMDTAAGHRKTEAREHEARFQLANAALLWLWHEENPEPLAVAQRERVQASRDDMARIISPSAFSPKYVDFYPDRSTLEQFEAYQKADAILALPAQPSQGAGNGEAAWSASTHDDIIERLMAGVGMPNSLSLYGAFKQFANELHALALAAPQPTTAGYTAQYPRRGIYIASKTKHADRWLAMRMAGAPIISTWIDEAGIGASDDLNDLWERCISEACLCAVLIVYREPDETLKGAWVEMGAALGRGTPVFAVGLREYTIANYKGIRHFDSIEDAFSAATPPTELCEGCPPVGYPTDGTRCLPCPRRDSSLPSTEGNSP